jgi:hypothetical protein
MNIFCPLCGDLIDDIVALFLIGMNIPDCFCDSCLQYQVKDW